MEKIRSKRREIEKLIARYDKDRVDLVSLPELASYSYENRSKISELLDEDDISYLKEQLIEPEWRLSHETFKDIKNAISSISIDFKDTSLREQKVSLLQE
jgi:predicted amidohydrolase